MYRLIIFGAGKYNYKRSALRLSRQARELHLFDEIIHYSERGLSIQYNNFWLTHKLLMENNKKYGFGIDRNIETGSPLSKNPKRTLMNVISCPASMHIL